MLADERGKYFQHRRAICCRVAGPVLRALLGELADPHVQLLGTELLDGPGIPVRDLPSAQHDQGPRDGRERDADQQASSKRQQPPLRSVPGRLQKRSPGRADVMMRKPVRRGHEQYPGDGQYQHGSSDPAYQRPDAPRPSSPVQHVQDVRGIGCRPLALIFRAPSRAGGDAVT